ncbi:MAG: hypothetical protein ABL956_09405 [Hyphomonadaceae bacterium]
MGRKLFITLVAALVASACASAPQPSNAAIADACLLLKENRPWHDAMRETARKWGAPMGFQLAVMKQESSFDSRALAPRGERTWFGLFEGERLSSASGYSQALDTTWDMYKRETGRGMANRQDFRDSSDFIGWYYNTTGKRTGVGQYDYKAHYLAYHEGATGYLKGAWKGKSWLVDTANRVASQAARYENQISSCEALKPQKFLGIF